MSQPDIHANRGERKRNCQTGRSDTMDPQTGTYTILAEALLDLLGIEAVESYSPGSGDSNQYR